MSKGKDRNKSCLCGSGKKYKKCCLNKPKPRITYLTMDMGKPVAANSLRISPTGKVELLSNGISLIPKEIKIETGYERKKGFKIINRAPLTHEDLFINPNRALEKYDLLCAIDTNTKPLNNGTVSVSCVVICKLTSQKEYTTVQYNAVNCLEFRNISGKPENIAWCKLIKLMMANPSYNEKMKVGIVVDSDLGNIPDYNARKIPIVDNFYLPPNVELLYASTDIGKEYLPNILISLCDKEANKLIKYIQENDNDQSGLETAPDLPCTHFRFWNK